MLRGLAFRLRDGAHGVVLVKPQFELPERRLRAGKADSGAVDDPALRRAALERFAEKAQRLGFTVVEHADSPVAGRQRHRRGAGAPALRRAAGDDAAAGRASPAAPASPRAARRPPSRGAGSWSPRPGWRR